jgi:hypothetical protein
VPVGSVRPERIVISTDVDTDVVRAVVVWVGVQREATLPPGGHYGVAGSVLHKVVVEVCTGSEAENQVSDLRLRIFRDVPNVARSVAPVIASDILLELEWVTRKSGVDRAHALRCVNAERLAVTTPSDLEFISTAHEVVVDRVERKQYPHPAIGLGVQH